MKLTTRQCCKLLLLLTASFALLRSSRSTVALSLVVNDTTTTTIPRTTTSTAAIEISTSTSEAPVSVQWEGILTSSWQTKRSRSNSNNKKNNNNDEASAITTTTTDAGVTITTTTRDSTGGTTTDSTGKTTRDSIEALITRTATEATRKASIEATTKGSIEATTRGSIEATITTSTTTTAATTEAPLSKRSPNATVRSSVSDPVSTALKASASVITSVNTGRGTKNSTTTSSSSSSSPSSAKAKEIKWTKISSTTRAARGSNPTSHNAQKQKEQPQKRGQEQKQKRGQQQQQQKQQQEHRVGVLVPSKILDTMHVQQGFNSFVEFFQVRLKDVRVDFLRDDDLSGFIELLDHPAYATVVKTLDVGLNAYAADLEKGGSTTRTTKNMDEAENEAPAAAKSEESAHDAVDDVGLCHLVERLSREYNKTVLLWPCSRMKESSNFLPSFEAISYAVQSIAMKLNWTQVQIFVGDQNWGLPLAIAANLHIPYKIDIGNDLGDLESQDHHGKAIIITADMNDASTLRLLRRLETLQHTKVLLIDTMATSFNGENRFYKNLAGLPFSSQLMSNLLLLTVLSDKYRHFLSVAFEDNGIGMVQNFRQQRRWRTMSMGVNGNGSRQVGAGSLPPLDWPMHLDSSVAQVIHEHHQHNQYQQQKHGDQPQQQHRDQQYQQQIAHLRNFIDFFNFYDFIIANILQSRSIPGRHEHQKKVEQGEKDKKDEKEDGDGGYDFIVLDVVRGGGSDTSASGVGSGTTSGSGSVANAKNNGNNHNQRRYNDNYNNSSNNNNTNNNNNSTTENNSNTTTTNYNNRRPHNDTFKWRPLLILEQHEINLNTYITHSILPGYDDWLRVSTSHLWHCGAICWTIVVVCVGVLFIIVAASVAAGIAMRNYLLRKRLSKGPNKIVLSANDFVFPVDSRRVDEGIEAMLCCWLQQLQEFGGPEVDKPDLLKGSIGSLKNLGLLLPSATAGTTTTTATGTATANGKNTSGTSSLARHNLTLLDMRARYNGDLVQLKEIPLNGSMELKSKAMDLLVMAHGLRHENINPLIGWLSDPNRTAMVFDYCSRGSLQDVLIMDEIKLDWSFRLSLLTDLVRGMRYLHTSPLRVHGALTSRNCVVDARWVLKITDYGLASFYDAQGLVQVARSAKELLWTAPELLRSMKPTVHHQGRVVGTQMGDVYSFGIIMQEVVVRGEPYCMLSLSAEEIIAKIKKPPPLIRPSVSKGAAPPEAINIMRQCWAEQPDMRPDFNSVYERFKVLNHGRKVNFVDTMFQMLEKYSNNLEELIRERTDQLDIERKKTEQLLNRMLPSSVAEKLKMGLAVDPEEFSDVTIYFSDIVGFTTIAAHCSPVQVVDLLNDLYTIFDATINAYNVYKVETIGDAYMVVSGVPVKIPDHAEQIATMALDLLHQSGRFNVKHLPGVPLQLRIGLHTGPCCAGVVGLTMPRYCLFGDTVNTASRMESTGSSWRIHMSQETRDRLEARGGYMIEPRGLIEIKGKGMMNTFWLLGKKGFEKQLPMPPPIGLDESLIRNSITLKAQALNKSRNSTNPSSSQSSSLAGESVEVKVEITPPTNADACSSNLPNSYSLDSNSTNTISPNITLCPEFPAKTPTSSTSPQSRKMSELAPESLLNASTFNRLPNSAGGSSSRLYKKIEEMMDLSSPYNHYKCLSPSESNLSQFNDGKYVYSGHGHGGHGAHGGSSVGSSIHGGSMHGGSAKFDSKPGSSRLLRRQFSLDRDDSQTKPDQHHQQLHQSSLQASHTIALCNNKSSMLDIPVLHDTSRSPKISLARVVHKQNSTSIAQDLEKIEEIPLSPASSQHHSSLDSNLNRSPPGAQSPPPMTFSMLTPNTPPSPSAPTTPTVRRSMNGGCDRGDESQRDVESEGDVDGKREGEINVKSYVDGDPGGTFSVSPSPPPLHAGIDSCTHGDSSATDASTTTTATVSANSTNNTTPAEEGSNLRNSELTLNVEALMTR